jgi:hypothetical protein
MQYGEKRDREATSKASHGKVQIKDLTQIVGMYSDIQLQIEKGKTDHGMYPQLFRSQLW